MRLSKFELTAYRPSRNVFLSSGYKVPLLKADLYGTRASTGQVKRASARNADKEKHNVGAVADALFKVRLFDLQDEVSLKPAP